MPATASQAAVQPSISARSPYAHADHIARPRRRAARNAIDLRLRNPNARMRDARAAVIPAAIPIALALTAARAEPGATTPLTVAAYATFLGWCFALCAVDLRERRLPNPLTGTGAAGVLGFAATIGRGWIALAGAILLAVPYLAIHLIVPAAFGAGDVKLAIGLGGAAACGGAQVWVWAALGAPVLTALVGGTRLLSHRFRRSRAGPVDSAIPHGPAMCLSTITALLLAHC